MTGPILHFNHKYFKSETHVRLGRVLWVPRNNFHLFIYFYLNLAYLDAYYCASISII